MNSVKKMDLIDLYYPTDETIAALLTVPAEQREAVLRRILGASEAGMDPHISRSWQWSMHSPAEIGDGDRITQGIRLEPAESLVSLDLDRQAIEGCGANFSRPVLGQIHHEYSQNPIPACI